MRTKIVKRHYCDHCGKGMFKIPSMERHERGCTANPNRVCRMCKLLKQDQPSTQSLIDFVATDLISPHEDSESIILYLKFCGGCPACMLTGIRLSRDGAGAFGYGFDFKAELERFWKDRNDAHSRAEELATYASFTNKIG